MGKGGMRLSRSWPQQESHIPVGRRMWLLSRPPTSRSGLVLDLLTGFLHLVAGPLGRVLRLVGDVLGTFLGLVGPLFHLVAQVFNFVLGFFGCGSHGIVPLL